MNIAGLSWLPESEPDIGEKIAALGSDGREWRRLASQCLDLATERKLHNKLRKNGAPPSGLGPVKIALLSDSNLEFVMPHLSVAGLRHGLAMDIRLFQFTQVVQQVMDAGSELHAFAPRIVILAYSGMAVTERAMAAGLDAARGLADSVIAEMGMLLRELERRSVHVIVQTIPDSPVAIFGGLDRRIPGTPRATIDTINKAIYSSTADILDVSALAFHVGRDWWFRPDHYFWHKAPFSMDAAPRYADLVARSVAGVVSSPRKVLILDLDNTIWGGVIGDDGLEGIELGQNSPMGEAFVSFQRYCRILKGRGIILAVCSKNDMANALLPFREHPEQVLKESDIAMFVANWTDKATNIRAIAAGLDLGLDSFVLVDDNPVERALVRRELPEVAVPEIDPSNPFSFSQTLSDAGYFETRSFTGDDKNRADEYRANTQRKSMASQATDLTSFLLDLDMRFSFARFKAADVSRITQLINRSNQFNVRTRRYTEAEVNLIARGDDPRLGFTARLADRFGDSGLIGVIICEPKGLDWFIDSWLMSCRVLGRQVEQATLTALVEAARRFGAVRLIGEYLPTQKNGMVAGLYTKLGFAALEDVEAVTGAGRYLLDIEAFVAPELPMTIACEDESQANAPLACKGAEP